MENNELLKTQRMQKTQTLQTNIKERNVLSEQTFKDFRSRLEGWLKDESLNDKYVVYLDGTLQEGCFYDSPKEAIDLHSGNFPIHKIITYDISPYHTLKTHQA